MEYGGVAFCTSPQTWPLTLAYFMTRANHAVLRAAVGSELLWRSCVARDVEEYVSKAIRLASDPQLRALVQKEMQTGR